MILYSVILAVTYVLDSRAKAAAHQTDTARLNEQLSYAQLNALQRQIEPHFIFNTLNSIAGLVRENRNDAAVKMIVALSDFLRRVAGSTNEARVRLAQEVEFLEKYLQRISKKRVSPGVLPWTCKSQRSCARRASRASFCSRWPRTPSSMALPGERREEKCVSPRHGRTACFHLTVYNDGPLLDRDGRAVKDGIGLSNLRTRLKLLYGSDFQLRLENYGITGVQVSLDLPYCEA